MILRNICQLHSLKLTYIILGQIELILVDSAGSTGQWHRSRLPNGVQHVAHCAGCTFQRGGPWVLRWQRVVGRRTACAALHDGGHAVLPQRWLHLAALLQLCKVAAGIVPAIYAVGRARKRPPAIQFLRRLTLYRWSSAAGLQIGWANAATAAGTSCMLLQQAAHKLVQRLEVHI